MGAGGDWAAGFGHLGLLLPAHRCGYVYETGSPPNQAKLAVGTDILSICPGCGRIGFCPLDSIAGGGTISSTNVIKIIAGSELPAMFLRFIRLRYGSLTLNAYD